MLWTLGTIDDPYSLMVDQILMFMSTIAHDGSIEVSISDDDYIIQ